MKRRAVLFDLDGTLLDTLDDIADSMNAALAVLGQPVHPVEAYRFFVGDGVETLARRTVASGPSDEAAEAFRAEYARRWDKKTRPYDGIPELLDALAGRGVGMAVLSNKPDDFTRMAVERYFPGAAFSAVRGMRPGGPKKPDPAAALDIAGGAGLEPAEFVYLGDTDTDMRTARAAGMHPVGALWGFRPAKELLDNGAQELLSAPRELLRFF
ncbi:MAG TPA: HAD family hydrolase [Elusimicrobia bacterium]|nr:HAD family hydrolase [Elusimicrobiota bacterium]